MGGDLAACPLGAFAGRIEYAGVVDLWAACIAWWALPQEQRTDWYDEVWTEQTGTRGKGRTHTHTQSHSRSQVGVAGCGVFGVGGGTGAFAVMHSMAHHGIMSTLMLRVTALAAAWKPLPHLQAPSQLSCY